MCAERAASVRGSTASGASPHSPAGSHDRSLGRVRCMRLNRTGRCGRDAPGRKHRRLRAYGRIAARRASDPWYARTTDRVRCGTDRRHSRTFPIPLRIRRLSRSLPLAVVRCRIVLTRRCGVVVQSGSLVGTLRRTAVMPTACKPVVGYSQTSDWPVHFRVGTSPTSRRATPKVKRGIQPTVWANRSLAG